ncbi:DUF3883 domain-containing protein [Rhizobium sp. ZPR3]|uniref:DUF3883 domain-containing protein n=2 Tax=unclassified Rhizobium TaxID=2613769 RepID=A0AAU7SRV1_9HYPH
MSILLNSSNQVGPSLEPVTLAYEADLLGNIQQALAGLQGFGIMALELMQNADDAGASSLLFDVTDNALVVRNTATFSTCGLTSPRCPWEVDGDENGIKRCCNFHAISRMGSRSKIHLGSQIGRFGIGFVSVYQITDRPIVRSAGIEMELDPLNGTGTTRVISTTDDTEFELPWALVSTATRKALNASPTPAGVVGLVTAAISEMLTRGLFFLRHLQRVDLRQNGQQVQSISIERQPDVVTLHIEPGAKRERWRLLSRDASDLAIERDIFDDFPTLSGLGRSPIVKIAMPLDQESVSGLLYAYLPTEQSSGLPLHINADFFPHPTRRTIVLTGEGHERYWNELLLDTAAKAIADDFDALRDLVGAKRLWGLVSAAYGLKDTGSFGSFWNELQVSAKTSASVQTVDSRWCLPAECFLPDLSAAAQSALANIGARLLHEDLRPHWTVLSVLGARPLTLPTVIAALEAYQSSKGFGADTPQLQNVWAAVDNLLLHSKSRPDFKQLVARVSVIPFVLSIDGSPAEIQALRRPEPGVAASQIRRYVPDCPFAHEEVLAFTAISEVLDFYELQHFARDISERISDDENAKDVIGIAQHQVTNFYSTLTEFRLGDGAANVGALLANVPILRTVDGFVSPSRGQLPGGFTDPIGHFELIDTAPMDEKMRRFTSEVLDVNVLTFNEYIRDHLSDILKGSLAREQYVALVQQILEHRSELDADGGLEYLARVPFVRTRDGAFAKPSDCYFWNETLGTLLGPNKGYFVDEDWMPTGRFAWRFRDLLEIRLGMQTELSIEHVVDRIKAIATAESNSIDTIALETQPIVRHVLQRFPRLKQSELDSLLELKTLAWLPASQNGTRIQGFRYPPDQLYRTFRSAAFYSQVKIIDLPILRTAQAGRALADFLDFLGMPEEPPTETIVAHLEYCMARDLPASDTVYAVLSERTERSDVAPIDRLAEKPFIYDADLKRYLRADHVFWTPTAFRGYWHSASSRMLQREPLYRRLGVQDTPSAKNYAALLQEVAGQATISEIEIDIHERCLAWLANALVEGDEGAMAAIVDLRDKPCLLSEQATVIWPDEAAWLDSDTLAEPFSGALDERLVPPPQVPRSTAAFLFKTLKVDRLSEIAHLRLTAEPDSAVDHEATSLLRDRAELILWLSPNNDFAVQLRNILQAIEVRTTDALQVQVEIAQFEPPVRSASADAPAFYDANRSILYVKGELGEAIQWTTAFNAIFASLEQLSYGVDTPPLVMTAAFVTSMSTAADAERALRSANYRPPVIPRPDQPMTESVADAPEEKLSETDGSEENEVDPDLTEPFEDVDQHDVDAPRETPGNARDAGSESNANSPPDAPGDSIPFKSREKDRGFGEASTATSPLGGVGPVSGGQVPNPAGWQSGGYQSPNQTRSAWHERRTRLLSYVNASPSNEKTEQSAVGSNADISGQIDMAAISAAVDYELRSGRTAVVQPHNNPGFDIVSTGDNHKARRLIEVKGLEGNWTERGIKLSAVQFATAQRYHNEYWIYVVENARDPQSRRVCAIANPFGKVSEYWFDHGWKDVTEETSTSLEPNLRIGARVRHSRWGEGLIAEINRRGIAISLLVDFLGVGSKLIPLNADVEFLE